MQIRFKHEHHQGVTLIELLITMAVMVVLFALLMPMLGTIRNEKNTIQCATNLRSLMMVFAAYSNDNGGKLPPGNVANPATFYYDDAEALDRYLKDAKITPDLLYCPGLLSELPATSTQRSEYWLDKTVPQYVKYHETSIGYFYLGNPTRRLSSAWKIRQPMPSSYGELSPINGEAMPFIFDKVSGPRKNSTQYGGKSPTTSSYTLADDNPDLIAPHRTFMGRPTGGNMGLSNGSVIRKKTGDMKLGYTYQAPSEVYW